VKLGLGNEVEDLKKDRDSQEEMVIFGPDCFEWYCVVFLQSLPYVAVHDICLFMLKLKFKNKRQYISL